MYNYMKVPREAWSHRAAPYSESGHFCRATLIKWRHVINCFSRTRLMVRYHSRFFCEIELGIQPRTYRKVASSRPVYYSILELFGQRSQYIRIKFPLHKPSENSWVCYWPKQSTARNFTIHLSQIWNTVATVLESTAYDMLYSFQHDFIFDHSNLIISIKSVDSIKKNTSK